MIQSRINFPECFFLGNQHPGRTTLWISLFYLGKKSTHTYIYTNHTYMDACIYIYVHTYIHTQITRVCVYTQYEYNIYVYIMCVHIYVWDLYICILYILHISSILKKVALKISFNFLLKITNIDGWADLIIYHFYQLEPETGCSAQYFHFNHLLCGIKDFLSSIPASYIFWLNVTEFSKNFSSFFLKFFQRFWKMLWSIQE